MGLSWGSKVRPRWLSYDEAHDLALEKLHEAHAHLTYSREVAGGIIEDNTEDIALLRATNRDLLAHISKANKSLDGVVTALGVTRLAEEG